jgi:flavodoxin
MDLSIIYSKLKNDQYITNILDEFEKDICLIICNCYIYNEIDSDMYNLEKNFESAFNKIQSKVIIF